MTREDNIFIAKRNIVDYIWKSSRLEGLAVTYPDTDAIFNGMSVANVSVHDVSEFLYENCIDGMDLIEFEKS